MKIPIDSLVVIGACAGVAVIGALTLCYLACIPAPSIFGAGGEEHSLMKGKTSMANEALNQITTEALDQILESNQITSAIESNHAP